MAPKENHTLSSLHLPRKFSYSVDSQGPTMGKEDLFYRIHYQEATNNKTANRSAGSLLFWVWLLGMGRGGGAHITAVMCCL